MNIISLFSLTLVFDTALSCFYSECSCRLNGDKSYDITCMPARNKHFPTRELNATSDLIINLLFITKYDFKSIPNDAFDGLSIKNLILADNQLESITEHAFRGIKSLNMLRLIEKNLQKIETNAFFSLAEKLEDLDLVGLDIKNDEYLDSFFGEINKLYKLNKFTLNNMKISHFKSEWTSILHNLNHLSVSSNNLKELDPTLFNSSKNLISLDLTNNNLSDLDKLFDALKPLEAKIKVLKLGGNYFEKLSYFPNFTNLEYLDLSNNRITHLDENSFANLTRLNYLYLETNLLTYLPDKIFDKCENLLTLKLNNNKLSQIPKIVKLSKLQRLDLSNQNGHLKIISNYAFERSVKLFSSLGLNLQSNDIETFSSRAFCSRYSNVIEIHDLNLSYNSYQHMNKCLLKQLNSTMVSRIYLRILPKEFHSRTIVQVCDCHLMKFLDVNKINLIGECQLGKDKCTVNKFDARECYSQTEFNC